MENNYHLIKGFEPKASHSYIIDTNVLMYLFSPIASYDEKYQEYISVFLDSCRRVNAEVITTSSIISEFFHVNLKMYFENWVVGQNSSQTYKLKKDYRPTEDFKESVRAINSSINSILKLSTTYPDGFNSININSVQSHCFHAEFTDSYIMEMANSKGWHIVSNDKDLLDHPNRTSKLIIIKE